MVEFHASYVCNLHLATTSHVSFVSHPPQVLEKRLMAVSGRLQRITKREKVNSIMGMIIAWQQLESGLEQRQ